MTDRPMAKRNDVPVKVDAEVVRISKIVAAYQGKTLAEYLSERFLPIAEKDLEAEQAKASQAKEARKGKERRD